MSANRGLVLKVLHNVLAIPFVEFDRVVLFDDGQKYLRNCATPS